jgi:hypothetical protein
MYPQTDMDIDLDIHPYQRIGPIHFGMPANLVEAALGLAERTRKNGDETVTSRFSSALKVVEAEAGVVEVSIHHPCNKLRLGDCRLFQEPPSRVLAHLCALDGNPQQIVGIIVLLNLGISLTGFEPDDEPYERSVTAFARGRFDKYRDRLVPYTVPAG